MPEAPAACHARPMDELRHPRPHSRILLASSLLGLLSIAAACGDDGGGASSGDGGSTSSSPSGSSSGGTASGDTTTGGDGGGTTTAGGGGDDASSTGTGTCTPDCADRACGDDGCDGSCGSCDAGEACSPAGQCVGVDPGSMSFFVTSEGNLSGDFGGLAGADQFCQELADAAGAGDRTWRAYVSTTGVDARDRIGSGPWYDAMGALVAESVEDLHASGVVLESAIDENGEAVPNGVSHPGFNEHDILTGSRQDGTYHDEWGSCADWTSSSPDDGAAAGHTDASRDAASPVEPSNNWNSAHATTGCDQAGLNGTGSTARLYCFAE